MPVYIVTPPPPPPPPPPPLLILPLCFAFGTTDCASSQKIAPEMSTPPPPPPPPPQVIRSGHFTWSQKGVRIGVQQFLNLAGKVHYTCSCILCDIVPQWNVLSILYAASGKRRKNIYMCCLAVEVCSSLGPFPMQLQHNPQFRLFCCCTCNRILHMHITTSLRLVSN